MTLLVRTLLTAVLLAATARAEKPSVHDVADLFSPGVEGRAEIALRDLHFATGLGVVVETAVAPPAEPVPRSFFGRRGPTDAAVTRWAKERATAAGGPDLFVLLCRQPLRVRVVLGAEVSTDRFSADNAAQLRRGLERRLLQQRADDGLLEAIQAVEAMAAENRRVVHLAFPWPTMFAIILGMLAVWLLLVALQEGAGHPASAGTMMGGLLGGMFGARAGHWLDSRLHPQKRRHRRRTPAVPGK